MVVGLSLGIPFVSVGLSNAGIAQRFYYVVLTDSMVPTLNRGDIAFTLPQDPHVESIVAFEGPLNDGSIWVHRVIEVREENGETTFITKGDNNLGADSYSVSRDSVLGVVVFKIPYIGLIFLLPPQSHLGIVIGLIGGYVLLSRRKDKTAVGVLVSIMLVGGGFAYASSGPSFPGSTTTLGVTDLPVSLVAGNLTHNSINLASVTSGASATIDNIYAFPSSNLIGLWHYGEGSGTTTADSSETGTTLSLQNSPTWTTTGKFGNALSFASSSSQHLNTSLAVSSPLNADNLFEMTIASWANPSSAISSSSATMIALSSKSQYAFGFNIANKPSLGFSDDQGHAFSATYSGGFAADTWYLVAATITFDVAGGVPTNVTLFVNGESIGSTGSIAGYTSSGPNDFDISRSANGTDYFDGIIDETSLWDKVLTSDQISSLYKYNFPSVLPLLTLNRVLNVSSSSSQSWTIKLTTTTSSIASGISNLTIYFLDPPTGAAYKQIHSSGTSLLNDNNPYVLTPSSTVYVVVRADGTASTSSVITATLTVYDGGQNALYNITLTIR